MSIKHFPIYREHLKLGKDAHVVQVIHETGWPEVHSAVVLVYYPKDERSNWAVFYPGGEFGHRSKFHSSLADAQQFIEQVLPVRFQAK